MHLLPHGQAGEGGRSPRSPTPRAGSIPVRPAGGSVSASRREGTSVEPVPFRAWRLRCDPAATRRALVGCVGSPERCGCLHCRNFAAARHVIYPPVARQLFERLGLDAACESEIVYGGPDTHGLHVYGGWFHFVGVLEAGPDALGPKGPGPHPIVLEVITERFKLGYTTHLGLVPASFGAAPVVQLEFEASVPWVLDVPPSSPSSRPASTQKEGKA